MGHLSNEIGYLRRSFTHPSEHIEQEEGQATSAAPPAFTLATAEAWLTKEHQAFLTRQRKHREQLAIQDILYGPRSPRLQPAGVPDLQRPKEPTRSSRHASDPWEPKEPSQSSRSRYASDRWEPVPQLHAIRSEQPGRAVSSAAWRASNPNCKSSPSTCPICGKWSLHGPKDCRFKRKDEGQDRQDRQHRQSDRQGDRQGDYRNWRQGESRSSSDHRGSSDRHQRDGGRDRHQAINCRRSRSREPHRRPSETKPTHNLHPDRRQRQIQPATEPAAVLTFTDTTSRRSAPESGSDDDGPPTFDANAGRDQTSPTTISVLASAAPPATRVRIPRVLVLASDLPPKPKDTKRRKTVLTQENYDSAKIYQSPLRFTSNTKKQAAKAAAKLARKEKRQADAARLAYQSSDVASSSSGSDDRNNKYSRRYSRCTPAPSINLSPTRHTTGYFVNAGFPNISSASSYVISQAAPAPYVPVPYHVRPLPYALNWCPDSPHQRRL
jgi:hypothetical protein